MPYGTPAGAGSLFTNAGLGIQSPAFPIYQSGTENIAIGAKALNALKNGSFNIAIGFNAVDDINNLNGYTVIGNEILANPYNNYTAQSGPVLIGSDWGQVDTTALLAGNGLPDMGMMLGPLTNWLLTPGASSTSEPNFASGIIFDAYSQIDYTEYAGHVALHDSVSAAVFAANAQDYSFAGFGSTSGPVGGVMLGLFQPGGNAGATFAFNSSSVTVGVNVNADSASSNSTILGQMVQLVGSDHIVAIGNATPNQRYDSTLFSNYLQLNGCSHFIGIFDIPAPSGNLQQISVTNISDGGFIGRLNGTTNATPANGTFVLGGFGAIKLADQAAFPAGLTVPANIDTAPQVAKAWAYAALNASPVINKADNIASITHSATGVYVVTFTTALPDANYAVIRIFPAAAGQVIDSQLTNRATTGFTLNTYQGAAVADVPDINMVVFG